MDLTKGVPRSPYERLGGIVFLPRTIDKGRADLAGTLGPYISRTGFSARLYEFLGIPAEEFIAALADHPTDEAMWEWISKRMTPRTPQEIEEFNQTMMNLSPQTPEQWERFRSQLAAMGQAHRTDIKYSFDRLDLDEGRDVPQGGRPRQS